MITRVLRPFFQKRNIEPFVVPGVVDDRSQVLVIDTGDLSDVLFFIPLVDGIRRRYPGSKIDFLIPEQHTPLIVPSGLARQCLVYSPKQMQPWRPAFGSLLRSLSKGAYDVAIVMSLSPNPVLELAALASGARLRFGPSHANSYPAINFEITPSDNGARYRGRRIQCTAPFFGLQDTELHTHWPLPEDKLRQMAQLVHFNKPRKEELLVGVDPGIGKSGKCISLANVHFLIRQLASQTLCSVLPLSDPANQNRLKKFETRLDNVTTGLKRDTLLETILLLAQCDLFVAGNTDLFHFAVAQQVPTIGLFTKHDGADWDPGENETTRVLRVTKDERVNIDTLMDAVEAVTGNRAQSAAPTIAIAVDQEVDAAAEGPATDSDGARFVDAADTTGTAAPGHQTQQLVPPTKNAGLQRPGSNQE